MKKFNEMKNGEKQFCSHCQEQKERSYWFLNGEICDFCLDRNKPCAICNKLKAINNQFEQDEIICKECKDKIRT